MDNKSNDMELLNAIPRDRENAIHQMQLAEKLHINTGLLKKRIQTARREGAPICSAQCGYWITDDEEELECFTSSMRRQGFSRLATSKPINDTLKQIEGQMSLLDYLGAMPEEELGVDAEREKHEQKQTSLADTFCNVSEEVKENVEE